MERGQGALEYLLLIGGSVVIAVVVISTLLGVGQGGGTGATMSAADAACAKYPPAECTGQPVLGGAYTCVSTSQGCRAGTGGGGASCPDGTCSLGENCPGGLGVGDDADCDSPSTCEQLPGVCSNGCVYDFTSSGQQDPGNCDDTTGCPSPPCQCDGAGGCVERTCPDGTCAAGESCPEDDSACDSQEPPTCEQLPGVCSNGCVYDFILAGQQDTTGSNLCDDTTGCPSPPCQCDGGGGCIDQTTCPDGTCSLGENCPGSAPAGDDDACVIIDSPQCYDDSTGVCDGVQNHGEPWNTGGCSFVEIPDSAKDDREGIYACRGSLTYGNAEGCTPTETRPLCRCDGGSNCTPHSAGGGPM